MDFTVTMAGLEDQLLGKLILKEKHELEEQRQQLLEEVQSYKKKIKQLEDDLLFRQEIVPVMEAAGFGEMNASCLPRSSLYLGAVCYEALFLLLRHGDHDTTRCSTCDTTNNNTANAGSQTARATCWTTQS